MQQQLYEREVKEGWMAAFNVGVCVCVSPPVFSESPQRALSRENLGFLPKYTFLGPKIDQVFPVWYTSSCSHYFSPASSPSSSSSFCLYFSSSCSFLYSPFFFYSYFTFFFSFLYCSFSSLLLLLLLPLFFLFIFILLYSSYKKSIQINP